ncbi:hypothetical protein [Bhargavaea cecembensis]|uniref:hypothetical protein n=1 Tax=Bhargavaea cecembensis TaxID=394098 RepID=UPI0015CF34CE|nr:hypothetical protein [Bhargavaea cecembensis]
MKLSHHVIIMVILIALTVVLYNRGLAAIPLILLSVQLFWLTFRGWRRMKKRT